MSENNDLERTQDLPTIPEESLKKTEPQFPKEPEVINNNGANSGKTPKGKAPKNSKGIFKKDTKVLNIIVSILAIAINVIVFYLMFTASRYASFSKDTFVLINIAALLILLIMDVLVMIMIRSKKIYIFVITVVIGCMLMGVGGYGVYAMTRVDTNVNKITASVNEQNVSASLVIYNGSSGDPIVQLSDLEGKKVGLAQDSHTAEIAQKRLEAEGINVEFVDLPGYTDVFTNLVNGSIDCAVLPVTYTSDFEEDETLSQYLPECTSLLDFSDSVVTQSTTGATKDITKEPFTVLVTGENEGLADTIIVMCVNPISMKIVMTSIARDSFVPITCYNNVESKINGAHGVSEDCLVNTVEQLMGITIDYTIEFNFKSVIQVVDAVGGVDVDISVGFDAQCWDVETDSLDVIPLAAGDNVHLNGKEALGFARERMAFADGDFARQRHQQEIIEQVISKIMATRDPQTFLDILDAAGDNIQTNFTVDQMTGFINYALQKAKRYYNSDSISGLFHFVTSRVYGYSSTKWDDGLQMDLWIYRVYNGSITDNDTAIFRNEDMTSAIGTSVPVNWSAANAYEATPISQEYYSEAQITDDGRPTETTVTATPESTPVATATPDQTPDQPAESATPVPTPDPTSIPEESSGTGENG